MALTTTIHGVAVNFGIDDDSIVTVRGAFQSREHSYQIQNESIRDGGDTTVSKVYYDPVEYATFTYIAVQDTIVINLDAHIDIPTMGEWVQIFDTRYEVINGWWLCEGITVNSSNTSAARVTINLARYPYVEKI